MSRKCNRCGVERDLAQFRTRPGHGSARICNPCDAQRRAQQRPPPVRAKPEPTFDNDLFRAAMAAFNRAFERLDT